MRLPLVLVSSAALLAACGEAAQQSADAPQAPAAPAAPSSASDAQTPPTAPTAPPPSGEQGGTDDWRTVANSADEDALSRIGAAWTQALSEAREAGFASDIRALGALADPDAAQPGRLQPPPGAYRCRTIKLGSRGGAGLGYVAYPWFRCTVELTAGGDLILMKTTGSQRIRGLLYPDNDRRLVLVGAEAWGSGETKYPIYGQTPERDRIGAFERIGPSRWRLVEPWPKQESNLNLTELVPA